VDKLNVTRDRFMDMLKAENIGCGIHFVSVHLQPYYMERLATGSKATRMPPGFRIAS